MIKKIVDDHLVSPVKPKAIYQKLYRIQNFTCFSGVICFS